MDPDKNSDKISISTSQINDQVTIPIGPKAHDCLKRWISVEEADEFKYLLKDSMLRKGTKQEGKRLNSLRIKCKMEV